MARNNDRGGSNRRAPKDAGRRIKKKPCALCKDRVEWVDYKDVAMLRKYMSDRGKIRARRVSGNCTQHQRDVAIAIKTARELVLLPYTQRTTTERPGGRGRGEVATGRPVPAAAVVTVIGVRLARGGRRPPLPDPGTPTGRLPRSLGPRMRPARLRRARLSPPPRSRRTSGRQALMVTMGPSPPVRRPRPWPTVRTESGGDDG